MGTRKFFEEMANLIDKPVIVSTSSNKRYEGKLVGFDPQTLSICLSDAKDQEGKSLPKVFINGSIVTEFFATEKPFELRKLAERLERVFPRLVKVYEDAGVVLVMDKIRLTKDGIIEGSGPAADRVKRVYEEFIKEA